MGALRLTSSLAKIVRLPYLEKVLAIPGNRDVEIAKNFPLAFPP